MASIVGLSKIAMPRLEGLDAASARAIVQNLVDSEAISAEAGRSLLAGTGDRALRRVDRSSRDMLRSDIFKQVLIHLV